MSLDEMSLPVLQNRVKLTVPPACLAGIKGYFYILVPLQNYFSPKQECQLSKRLFA